MREPLFYSFIFCGTSDYCHKAGSVSSKRLYRSYTACKRQSSHRGDPEGMADCKVLGPDSSLFSVLCHNIFKAVARRQNEEVSGKDEAALFALPTRNSELTINVAETKQQQKSLTKDERFFLLNNETSENNLRNEGGRLLLTTWCHCMLRQTYWPLADVYEYASAFFIKSPAKLSLIVREDS